MVPFSLFNNRLLTTSLLFNKIIQDFFNTKRNISAYCGDSFKRITVKTFSISVGYSQRIMNVQENEGFNPINLNMAKAGFEIETFKPLSEDNGN